MLSDVARLIGVGLATISPAGAGVGIGVVFWPCLMFFLLRPPSIGTRAPEEIQTRTEEERCVSIPRILLLLLLLFGYECGVYWVHSIIPSVFRQMYLVFGEDTLIYQGDVVVKLCSSYTLRDICPTQAAPLLTWLVCFLRHVIRACAFSAT